MKPVNQRTAREVRLSFRITVELSCSSRGWRELSRDLDTKGKLGGRLARHTRFLGREEKKKGNEKSGSGWGETKLNQQHAPGRVLRCAEMFRLLLIATAATPPQKPHLIPDSIGISTLSGAVELVVARSELPVTRGAALTLGSAAQRNLNVTVVGGAGAPTRLNIASAALRFSDEPIDGWRVPAANMRLAVDAMGEQVIVTLTPPAGRASFTNVAAFSAAFNVLRSFDTLDADGDGVLDWEEAGAWDAPRLGGEVRGGVDGTVEPDSGVTAAAIASF